jgi:hypothetical protein
MGMTANGGSPGANVVDVLVIIDIPDVGTFDAIEDDGLATDRFEGANRRTNATGHEVLSGAKNFF